MPVRELLPDAMRLGVDLNSPPNMLCPEAPTGPEDPLELLEPDDPDDPPLDELPPPDDVPPEDDVAVPLVRGTACPAIAGVAIPAATMKVIARIDLVMAAPLGLDDKLLFLLQVYGHLRARANGFLQPEKSGENSKLSSLLALPSGRK